MNAQMSVEIADAAIVTPDRRLRVFVSSTLDLVDERAVVRRAIESLMLAPVMFEAGARAHPPRALYRAYVEQSDVFIAIYASRYGWVAPGMDVSGLEDEYNLSSAMPRLVYIQAGVHREPELETFLERVRDDGLSYRRFSTAEELEQLVSRDLVVLITERFHSAGGGSAAAAAPAPLPAPSAPFIGRDRELAELGQLLARDDVRLVTLVGPGGIGKTRLAIAAGRELAHTSFDDSFFVSLVSVRDPAQVPDTIASALGVAARDAYPAIAAIADFIGERRVLLILDNFEQVVASAVTVPDLLSACPQTKMLVTSRAALRLRGEHEVAVRQLDVPSRDAKVDTVADFAAVKVFVEYARAVQPAFDLDERSLPAVAEICRELDGLPLAIELAAAMVRVLPPPMILDRLRARLASLHGGARDMPERHQRLDATIAWSYELLDDAAASLFAQLGCFRGGFTLQNAEQVCDIDADVLDALGSLVEQSLVVTDFQTETEPRFSMLGVIQRFAEERLEESPLHDDVLDRHGQMFAALAERVGQPGGRHKDMLDEVEVELDNIRRAFEWLLDNGDTDVVGDAIGESWWFWWIRGYLKEGTHWALRCLDAPQLGRHARSRALLARGMFAIWMADYDIAAPALAHSAATACEVGDRKTAAYAEIGLGLISALTTSVDDGTTLIRSGTAAFEQLGDDNGAATGLAAASWVQAITRQFAPDDAGLRDALARARMAESDIDIGIVEAALAQRHASRGETRNAIDLLEASLEHLATVRHIGSTILTLEVIAELAITYGAADDAAVMLGATAGIRSAMGTRVPPAAATRLKHLIDAASELLGSQFQPKYGRGGDMNFDEAVQHGRSVLLMLRPQIAGELPTT